MAYVKLSETRLGEERVNSQGDLMKVVVYNNSSDIVVEFQDKYKACVHTGYDHFIKGKVKNPFHKSVYNIATTGNTYAIRDDKSKQTKEYKSWILMLRRCFDEKHKEKNPTYKDATCCEDWLLFDNFYEWLHNQRNFDKWYHGDRWAVDKDILVKGNKIYSPNTCCLVPYNVNTLFVKHDNARGDFPIGVRLIEQTGRYEANCNNPFPNGKNYIGKYDTVLGAFNAYKNQKEKIIKQVANEEYKRKNIVKECYEAMINYKVEITD